MADSIKLGKMEKDYGACSPMGSDKPDKDEAQVERFPTVYISRDSLPELEPGQEVMLKGIVGSFSDRKTRRKEDGKEEVDVDRSCEIDVIEMTPGAKKEVSDPPEPASDLDAISKGLDAAAEDDDDEEEEEEETP